MALCRSCGSDFDGSGESCSYLCWVGGGSSSFNSLRKRDLSKSVDEVEFDVMRSAKARDASGARRAGGLPSHKTWLHIAGLLHNSEECAVCGCVMHYNYMLPNGKNIDHIVEIADGGEHVIENLQVICRRCNGRKAAEARMARRS